MSIKIFREPIAKRQIWEINKVSFLPVPAALRWDEKDGCG